MAQSEDDERRDTKKLLAAGRRKQSHARNSADVARETVQKTEKLIEQSKALLDVCRARYP